MFRPAISNDWRQLLVLLLALGGLQQLASAGLIQAKAWLAPILIEWAWETSLYQGGSPVKPWPWADTWPVARLRALGGDIDLIVLAGGSGRTLAFGPGHLSASALPGQPGNAVIAGHRDTHFGFLQRLAVGEPLAVETVNGRSHLYQVVHIDVVDARRSSLLLDTEDSVVSLVTCYPFDALEPGGPMRYVVTARKLF